MTQPANKPTASANGTAVKPKVGPHPGFISSSNQYSSETRIRRMFRHNGCDPAREDNYRLQGVQLIDNVREHLKLPVRTFDTACIYFHKFRLNYRDAEYSFQDAALASLFVACKVEDTIKKSKDILAAAYAVKNPDKPVSTDDKEKEQNTAHDSTTNLLAPQILEQNGKIIIGLERHILETIGFDFRTRYPQKLLVKVIRRILGPSVDTTASATARTFYATAYAMCIDMYKTLVPVKRTTFAMAMAVVELTARLTTTGDEQALLLERIEGFSQRRQHSQRCDARAPVVETMLDLLDLYVQNHKATKLGARFDLARFIDIKIQLNQGLDASAAPRFLYHCQKCEIDAPSETLTTKMPLTLGDLALSARGRSARGQDGTMRFVFDPEAAKAEHDAVGVFFNEEYEEYEMEIEEPVPPPPEPRGPRDGREGGGGGGGGEAAAIGEVSPTGATAVIDIIEEDEVGITSTMEKTKFGGGSLLA
ncbi:cyclin [Cordyceps fumosorosea ARSEF 2679]|uniref:RNA polymerase II holoenzyme cyclin-like subunit n=1 Tax=Cordyceps fumosorosea (strain ARSEF 2679) TaxID=1081104 RepID=A0A167RL42_CORFA|nr:cyclin [Cordyceps fumosorosea ARSEF 2679]OAA58700.1 cyclin [Cordyceps fumosorosea ARSEF 2679]